MGAVGEGDVALDDVALADLADVPIVGDAKEVAEDLLAAIDDPDPVIFFEPKRRYHDKGEVDVDAAVPPLSPARILRPGSYLDIRV